MSVDFKTERVFLAAVPDAATAARIHRLASILKRAHRFEGRLIPAERLHISLFFLGSLHDAGIQAACEAARDIARARPFDVSFDRTASFGGKTGNHPLVLYGEAGLEGLRSFRRAFATAMLRKGLPRPAKSNFAPHVTLLYGERLVEEYPIDPIGWTVNELVLIRSLRGHTHVGRWSLGEGTA